MSWRIANECAERRFGSAARKQIIMFLANKASDDGSGIWCSKGFVQRHTELSETSVKRTISDFLREGILVQTGQHRPCKNGFTVVYRIDMDVVAQLELIGATWLVLSCFQSDVFKQEIVRQGIAQLEWRPWTQRDTVLLT